MADVSPYQYIKPTGLILPDTSVLLEQTQDEWKAAFGDDLVVTPDTPQGVLITAETLARDAVVRNNAAAANQINPNEAGGVFLDGIMALTGIQRTPASRTVVKSVIIAGVPGALIPTGAQTKTIAGDLFETTGPATLDTGGNGTVEFRSVEYGPIACGVGALTVIVTAVLGWETVVNPTAGILGSNTQSDKEARAYRKNTLAFQGLSLPEAITSALYAVEGVTSLSFRENYNSEPMGMLISVTGGVTLAGGTWGLTTTGEITVGTTAMQFGGSTQALPSPNPWPVAAFGTTGNITLSGLATQAGGDWAGALTAGNIILVKNQSTASQNGVWVAAAGAWARHAYAPAAAVILGSNDGISMIRNSVYACVDGGLNTEVADALLENKSSGAGWNGGTAVARVEKASGQTYTVKFDRPLEIGVLFRVTIKNGTTADVKQAILDYANGRIDGENGFTVGQDVSPFEIAGAINKQFPAIYVANVELSPTSVVAYTNSQLAIALNQVARTQDSYITVVLA